MYAPHRHPRGLDFSSCWHRDRQRCRWQQQSHVAHSSHDYYARVRVRRHQQLKQRSDCQITVLGRRPQFSARGASPGDQTRFVSLTNVHHPGSTLVNCSVTCTSGCPFKSCLSQKLLDDANVLQNLHAFKAVCLQVCSLFLAELLYRNCGDGAIAIWLIFPVRSFRSFVRSFVARSMLIHSFGCQLPFFLLLPPLVFRILSFLTRGFRPQGRLVVDNFTPQIAESRKA